MLRHPLPTPYNPHYHPISHAPPKKKSNKQTGKRGDIEDITSSLMRLGSLKHGITPNRNTLSHRTSPFPGPPRRKILPILKLSLPQQVLLLLTYVGRLCTALWVLPSSETSETLR
jgi:hypothetical protein